MLDIFKEEVFYVPVTYSGNSGFTKSIDKLLLGYESILKRYNYPIAAEKVNKFRLYLREMYHLYNRGMHAKAYKKFTTALKHLDIKDEKLVCELEEKSFYRARVNNTNRDYSAKEMLHIPFNMRGRVKTERFSAPGLSCLYLGSSPYVCWVELDRPSFETFQVAKINRIEDNSICIMDLSILPQKYTELYDTKYKDISIEEYLCIWPIILISSVKVRNETDDYKPEYVFPQFLLEYILSDSMFSGKVMGIKYASLKIGAISNKQYDESWETYTSYVIPTDSEEDATDVLDKFITEHFEVSSTESGKELQLMTDVVNGPVWEDLESEKASTKIYTNSGTTFNYEDSIFYRIELSLNPNFENSTGKVVFSRFSDEEIKELFKKDKSY